MPYPFPNPSSHSTYPDAAVSVAYTGTAGRTALLSPGTYYITASTDCFFLQGGSAVTATSSSNPLWSKERVYVTVNDATDGYISAIQQSSGGTLYATRAVPPKAR